MSITAVFLFVNIVDLRLSAPNHPNEHITRDDRRECERNADLHKLPDADLITLFAQNAEPRDVSRSADRGEISAECGAREKSEV